MHFFVIIFKFYFEENVRITDFFLSLFFDLMHGSFIILLI